MYSTVLVRNEKIKKSIKRYLIYVLKWDVIGFDEVNLNKKASLNILVDEDIDIDEQLLKYIAQCESKMNPQAVNGPYGGLFQFTSRTWITTRQAMPADSNSDLRFNPEEAIKTAAFKISRGGLGAWPSCNKL